MRAFLYAKDPDSFFSEVKNFLENLGVTCIFEHPKTLNEGADFSVVLGGDGTVLAAGRAFVPNPVIVVNTGHLGFLTSSSKENYQETLTRFLEGRYTLTKRHTLTVTVRRYLKDPLEFYALNEVVVAKNQLSKLVKVAVKVKDGLKYESISEYRADGLIVSTPTGSTAYNLSAGGPIIHPGCQNIVITPICPQGLTQRSLVIPSNLTVVIQPMDDNLYVSVDGQDGCPMTGNVEVKYNDHAIEIMNPTDSYFHILREKLQWGIRPV